MNNIDTQTRHSEDKQCKNTIQKTKTMSNNPETQPRHSKDTAKTQPKHI